LDLTSTESPAFVRLVDLLKELFEFDKAELDFGIYRIMNQKREEVSRFFEHDLLPEVRTALADYGAADRDAIEAELDTVRSQLREVGVPYEASAKYRDLQTQLAASDRQAALEEEVYSDLYRFFKRYYKDGDFLSLRRYKEGVYAIPYEGEEVKLYWTNHDQYYVKSSESFQNYRFRLPDARHVHFRLAAASTERDNNKSAEGRERRFVLREELPMEEVAGELNVYFEYRESATKQADLNKQATSKLLGVPEVRGWRDTLAAPWPTQVNPGRTLFEKHLTDYTARNTFDYFIHKDLGSFLRRELDFFLKNEVLLVDDLDVEDEQYVGRYLAKLRAIKRIGRKVIEFLGQIENFQKRLWLKKKFVFETGYCVTLDRVPEDLYPEIAANAAQRMEWVRFLAIGEIRGDLVTRGYSEPLTVEFLKANPHLVLDTKLFAPAFKQRLLAAFDDLDSAVDGLLVNGENFQALSLLSARYRAQVKCIYIDPPFNLGANADFLYKTDYADSTWLTLLENRISNSLPVWSDDALFFARCDYHGSHLMRQLLEHLNLVFKAEILIDRSRNEVGSPNKMEVTYEHLFMFTKSDIPITKFTVPRSVANIQWTGFMMAGDRNPPQRVFLGKEIFPPKGQHFALRQEKVEKLLGEFHLRLRCRSCGSLYFYADSDTQLQRRMKTPGERFKFYDITVSSRIHGLSRLDKCLDCGADFFAVEYLGSDEVYVNDNWLDIPSYSRRWDFATENSEELMHRVISFNAGPVLDFFAGSGTTAVVAQKSGRKWIAIESGSHFDGTTLRRMKATLSDDRTGISQQVGWAGGGFFKYLRLESYEDTLNNLELRRPGEVQALLDGPPNLREDYLLHYMLDLETRDSASLLDVHSFEDPFSYQLRITDGGESSTVTVDLVETFNWLLGLKVKKVRVIDGFRTVEGTNPEGKRILVIWRRLSQPISDDEALGRFFLDQGYGSRPEEGSLDRVYVNGDCTLASLRRESDRWDVLLIEEEFKRLMFETAPGGAL
jgi:adenine-specific DNA-methyltransferase